MKHIKKLFVSADIEGTAGITRWEETENGHPRYAYFQDQMSREVAAACRGGMRGNSGEGRSRQRLQPDSPDAAGGGLPFPGLGQRPHEHDVRAGRDLRRRVLHRLSFRRGHGLQSPFPHHEHPKHRRAHQRRTRFGIDD